VWLGKKLEVGGQWDGRLTLTFWLTEQPDDHWVKVFNLELADRQDGLQATLDRGDRHAGSRNEAVLVFRDVGLEALRETLDDIGDALATTDARYASDLRFTEVIGREALEVVKDWREGLRRPDGESPPVSRRRGS
jgi:hypothetical protein